MLIQLLAIGGIILSAYGFKASQQQKPWCDISSNISCSKAFQHKKAKHAGVPNTIWGIIFYTTILIISIIEVKAILALATMGILFSLYLAYIQYTQIKTLCIICTTAYLINILLFLTAIQL